MQRDGGLPTKAVKHTPDLAPLLLNEVPLDKVVSHKVLGMTIMDNLKWNKNTNEILSKASKRLHIIRVLKKAGVPSNDLTCIYYIYIYIYSKKRSKKGALEKDGSERLVSLA